MSHHSPVIDNLKRLLLCNRRRKSAIRSHGNTSPTSLATVSTTTNCMDSSPDSLNCQPRLTASEIKRRRSLHPLQVSNDCSESEAACYVCIKGDDSDTIRTLCSGCTEDDEGFTDTEKPQNTTVRQTSLSCYAEIYSLETADDCARVQDAVAHTVARTEDLVVTEYRTECQLSNERPKMVVNNTLICCNRQLNSELCEVNCPQSDQIETLHVSNNLANVFQYQAGKCSATAHQDACQRSPLRVYVLSEESEPRTSCAFITTSEPPSVESLPTSCWPDGDAMGPDEAQVDAAAECKRPSGDAEAAKCGDTAGADARVLINSSENTYDLPKNPYPTTSNLEDTALANKNHANNRFGTLSSELCVSLHRGLHGDDLIKRYLEKRDISETVRARHRQRCGSINASMVEKILQKSAEATCCATAAANVAATLRGKLPKTSSANATDVSDRSVVLSIAPSKHEFRSVPVVSIVASVAAAANAMAAVARANTASASAGIATTAGRTKTPEGAGGDMRRRKARLATGSHAAKILVPVVLNLRARRREQHAA